MIEPKLALIPSAYKANKVYSVLPNDGTGDFDFTRSGNATRVNKEGLIETVGSNVPRLNYPLIDGVVSGCPSLLLEPERTNNLVQSNQFDTTWNIPTGITLTGSQLSPLTGGLDAWKLESDGSNGFLAINQATSVTGTNTFSIYAKAGTNRYLSLRGLSGIDTRAQFDLQNGEVYGSNNVVSVNMDYIKDGWWRCSLTFNASNNIFYIYPSIQGIADAGYIYIQNSQLEGGSFETSYVPTTTSAETRSAETCNNAGDVNTFNDSEGVLFAEISALVDNSGDFEVIQLFGDTDNFLNVGYRNNANNNYFYKEVGGVPHSPATPSVTTNILNNNKVAVSYSESTNYLWLNGFKLLSSTGVGSFAAPLSKINFDSNGAGHFYGNTKQLQYFPTALNDTDLETLTSWRSFNEMAISQLYSVY